MLRNSSYYRVKQRKTASDYVYMISNSPVTS